MESIQGLNLAALFADQVTGDLNSIYTLSGIHLKGVAR